eukprot:g4691.t1
MSRFHASRLPAATTALVHVALGGFNISLCGVASATRGGGGLRGKARHELESSSANLTATLTAFDLVVIDDKKKQGHDSREHGESGKKYDVTPEQHGELWCVGLPNSVLAPGDKQKPAVANLPKEPDAPQKEEEKDQGDPMEGQNGSTPEDVIGPWLHADKKATKIDPAFKFTAWDYCKQLGQTCTCNTTGTTPPSGYDGVTPPATTPPDAVRGKCVVYAGCNTNGENPQGEYRPTAQIHGNMFCEKNVATDALLAAEGTKQNDEGKTRSADGNGKTDANDKADDKKGESDALLAEEGTKQKGEEKTPNANGIGKPDAKEKADDKKGAATRVGISVVALLLPMGLTAAAILQ